MDKPGLDCQMC